MRTLNRSLFFLWIVTFAVFLIGLLMVYNTTSAIILEQGYKVPTYKYFLKQLLFFSLGLVLSGVVYGIGYKNLIRLSRPLLLVTTFFLFLVFIPPFGRAVNGAHRWVQLGPLTFQPSELAKIVLPLYFISKAPSIKSFRDFLHLLSWILVPLLLVLIEPANGTCAILCATLGVLMWLYRFNLKWWLLPAFVVLGLAIGIGSQLPYVSNRLKAYKNPEEDLRGRGHQPFQAKIAAGSGGLLGRGLGQSLQKMRYLPEAQNDYIGAIYAEEFGFMGILFLISLYGIMAYLGFSIALSMPLGEPFYMVSGLTFLVTFQAFLNLGVISGLLPPTGINLPFFSQGGTSLTINMIAWALISNIVKEGKVCQES